MMAVVHMVKLFTNVCNIFNGLLVAVPDALHEMLDAMASFGGLGLRRIEAEARSHDHLTTVATVVR